MHSPAITMNPHVVPPDQSKVVDLTEDAAPREDDSREPSPCPCKREDRSARTSTQGTGPPGVSQEDQDVGRALEASLLESGVTRRKKDPQNPLDREREGQVSLAQGFVD